MDQSEIFKHIRNYRNVFDPCEKCGGTGVTMYSNTSKWRGGFGGQMITSGQCDSCWGSGDKYRPWENLRLMEQRKAEDVREEAAKLFEAAAGFFVEHTLADCPVEEVCKVLDDASKPTRRKTRPRWFNETCRAVSRALRGMAEARRAKGTT